MYFVEGRGRGFSWLLLSVDFFGPILTAPFFRLNYSQVDHSSPLLPDRVKAGLAATLDCVDPLAVETALSAFAKARRAIFIAK